MKLLDNDIWVQYQLQGVFVYINCNFNQNYTIKYINNNNIIYDNYIECIKGKQYFTSIYNIFYMQLNIEVYNSNNVLVFEWNNKQFPTIYIICESSALGDNISWVPYINKFQTKHNCNINYYIPPHLKNILNELLCDNNNIKLYNYNEFKLVKNIPIYRIGYFDGGYDLHKHPQLANSIPLQQIATDILGLQYEQIQPIFKFKYNYNPFPFKYVCISNNSTTQSKLWNYEGGWQYIIDYINSLGIKVIYIGKEECNLNNIINLQGDNDLYNRIGILQNCEFFIGLPSGLSWLAWACNKPVIMISGFSNPYTQFKYNNYRVYNKNALCKDCFNRYKFNGDWYYCPDNNDFICSRSITPNMIILKIQQVLLNINRKELNNN